MFWTHFSQSSCLDRPVRLKIGSGLTISWHSALATLLEFIMAEPVQPKNEEMQSAHFAQSIDINSFRGLKDVSFENLQQVNLLVGENNSGKTSILEAIAVLYAANDLWQWLDVSMVREVRSFASGPNGISVFDTIRWMFPCNDIELWEHGEAGEILISAETPRGRRHLQASSSPFDGFLNEKELRPFLRRHNNGEPVADHGIDIKIDYSSPNEGLFPDKDSEMFQIWSKIGLRKFSKHSRNQRLVQYISPYGHRNSSTNISALSRSLRDDNIEILNDLMASLDDRISGIELVTSGDNNRPQIAIRMKDRKLVPVSVMGDGIRRALSISLSILASRNGILLIDEIEAAFHVGAFSKVFDWLMKVSDKYKVQIFATTHSLEAIEAIAKSDTNRNNLGAYAIGPEAGHVAKRYTGGMLQRLVVESGLDIRF